MTDRIRFIIEDHSTTRPLVVVVSTATGKSLIFTKCNAWNVEQELHRAFGSIVGVRTYRIPPSKRLRRKALPLNVPVTHEYPHAINQDIRLHFIDDIMTP